MAGNIGVEFLFFSFIFLIYLSTTFVTSYKPVIIVHGILDSPKELSNLKTFILKSHPGTNVTIIDAYNDVESFEPLWRQVKYYGEVIGRAVNASTDGIHLICYSQGGLICRGVVSTLSYHNVNSFISLSAPQNGQYGDTSYLRYFFPHYMKHNIYMIFYSTYGQYFSVANYWNDPHQRELYMKYSDYLAQLNNETKGGNPKAEEWKKNFMRIKDLILIGGPDDGVITPWQSSHFASFDANESVVPMRNQKIYVHDTFGLKSLDKRGAIKFYEVLGVSHVTWHSNWTVFEKYIEPWLT